MSDRSQFTVVFDVVDKDQLSIKGLYDLHKNGGNIFGLSPRILAWGDKVSVPGEIVMGLLDVDPQYPDKIILEELCNLAEKYIKGEG